MTYCGHPICTEDICKAVVCPAITANKTPVQKEVMAWSTMPNEFHTVCAVNGTVPAAQLSDNVTYYAWSKKHVTVTFDVNGNQ